MKILAAIDGSGESLAAMQAVLRLTKTANREVDVLCVAPGYRKGSPDQHTNKVRQETTRILEAARKAAAPVAVRLLTATGSAAAILADRTSEYDLTAIGAKGWGTNPNAGLGAVAGRVAGHALGAIFVARPAVSETGARILVCADGSTASLRAMETLQGCFDLDGSEICLMHVEETPWIHLGLEEDWVSASEEEQEQSEAGELEQELVREGDAILEEARMRLEQPKASVATVMAEGNPANEILSEAERGQYDLIVVGATGIRDLKHQMLGSVSSKIVWDAPCSVLLVREPEEA